MSFLELRRGLRYTGPQNKSHPRLFVKEFPGLSFIKSETSGTPGTALLSRDLSSDPLHIYLPGPTHGYFGVNVFVHPGRQGPNLVGSRRESFGFSIKIIFVL